MSDKKYDGSFQLDALLAERQLPAEFAQKVCDVVHNVSYSNEAKNPKAVPGLVSRLPELGIVQDADRLDAIGAIGVARAFGFGCAKKPERGLQGCVDHFDEKLFKLGDMMKVQSSIFGF